MSSGWTAYGIATSDSRPIYVHLGWLESPGRTVFPWTCYWIEKCRTWSGSMRNWAQNQNRSRPGTRCLLRQKRCRVHWFLLCHPARFLCTIGLWIDTCVRRIPRDICSCIFSCWHDKRHHMCRHFDRGQSGSSYFDNLNRGRSGENLPKKQEYISCVLLIPWLNH